MSNEVTDVIIDRMVDGELNEKEQRQLLLACEQHPEHWREMALAYVESQTWHGELSELTKPVPAEDPVVQMARSTNRVSSGTRVTPWKVLNVAAMLLLSLTVGYGIGAFDFTSTTPNPNIVAQPTPNSNRADQVVVWVPDSQGGGLQPMNVPVKHVDNLNTDELAQHNRLSSEVLKALEKNGHGVTRNRTWHPVQLKDGRGAFVPTDNLNVQFTGYQ